MSGPVEGDGTLLPYALAAARRGWHVFPLHPGGKRPPKSSTDWENLASTDPDQLRAWFARRPFNVGIACGPSGLVVVDLDTPKPGEAPPAEWDQPGINDGADVLAALCERHGQPFPFDTFAVRTRSGGMHLYFAAPPGLELRNTQYRPPHDGRPARGLGWLIDTRAHGGYVVGPGSRVNLPDGAGTYDVIHRAAPAPLPDWLAALIDQASAPSPPVGCSEPVVKVADVTGYANAALRGEVDRVLRSPEHGHNWALNKAAYNLGRHIGAGTLPREPAEQALQTAGEAVHTRDTPAQIAATIRAGIDAGACNPKRTAA